MAKPNPDDIELFGRIGRGDQSALEALYVRYFKRLCHFVAQLTQNPDDTLEVVNDVFLVVWRSVDSFKGQSNPSTWIMGIAYNKAMSALSKKRSWLVYNDKADAAEDCQLEKLENEDQIRFLLCKLRPEERAAFELTYYFGYSYDEISSILDCPKDTIKNRLYLARKRIRQELPERNEQSRGAP